MCAPRRNIPFVKFGGLKFLDATHVKDVLAFQCFAGNPKDWLAAFRVVQLVPDIGPSTSGLAPEAMERAPDPCLDLPFFRTPALADDQWTGFVDPSCVLRSRISWSAGPEG